MLTEECNVSREKSLVFRSIIKLTYLVNRIRFVSEEKRTNVH